MYFSHSCLFDQYYYSVRVFAGQELGGVWVGWITPDYHQYDPHFDISKVRNVTVTVGDDKGNIHDRCCLLLVIFSLQIANSSAVKYWVWSLSSV